MREPYMACKETRRCNESEGTVAMLHEVRAVHSRASSQPIPSAPHGAMRIEEEYTCYDLKLDGELCLNRVSP